MEQKTTSSAVKLGPIEAKEFFENVPPGVEAMVTGVPETLYGPPPNPYNGPRYVENLPDLVLHCSEKECGGFRLFQCETPFVVDPGKTQDAFILYRCKNCGFTFKTYAILAHRQGSEKVVRMFKYGERPAFGPPLPSKLIELVRPEWDYFQKGRRVENQGLGIGAFSYYRRVIEDQKNRILDEIIKAATKLNAARDLIKELERAKIETQFTKALEGVKSSLPEQLMIASENPLLLLHDALSEGMHKETDEECLKKAGDIRVIMTELAERLSQALKEDSELKAAVSRLQKLRQERKTAI